ncbi:tyrosine-type recombinase/integrase [Meiothermus sp.]|uniref:tyrosine-type recombinase/integrase n=1 Tax=Meiothermus sp. TaxID=1955249 RepID=UPI0026120519|nr:tyrosine-type recombinase/integrase [Meiothermus sp.]
MIFPSEAGTPLSYRNVKRTFRGLIDNAGLPRIGLHGLRHTYTSLALQAVLSPKQVADRLRHKGSHAYAADLSAPARGRAASGCSWP